MNDDPNSTNVLTNLSPWHKWLINQGGHIGIQDNIETVLAFTSPTSAGQQGCIYDLEHLGLLRIRGEQAASFINGYVTCDVEKQDDNSVQTGCYCNRQGRVVADFEVIRTNNTDIILRMSADLQPVVATSLQPYIMFAKAEIEPIKSIALGLKCHRVPTEIEDILGPIPLPGKVALSPTGFWFCHLAGGRYEIFVPPATAKQIWQVAYGYLSPRGVSDWDRSDIEQHRARLSMATSEKFLPQALGYTELNAVSFTKGCYLGQEVIARTQHLGNIKRILTRLGSARTNNNSNPPHLLHPPHPKPSEWLLNSDAKKAANVIRAVQYENGWDILAIVGKEFLEQRLHHPDYKDISIQKI